MRFGWKIALLAVVGALVSCESGRRSPAGFRLPETGDVERGKAAFIELQCNNCHTVAGVEMPAPDAQPDVTLALGGRVHEVRTDGYLVTSIIHPSHKLVGHPRNKVAVDGESRMPDFTQKMTVRQLVDIVAFLQSSYEIVYPQPYMYP